MTKIHLAGYRVLICGSRDYDNSAKMTEVFDTLERTSKELIIIEGGARGADTMARRIAQKRGIWVEEYPALWDKYGKAAGPIRNAQMLKEGKPDIVYAFFTDHTRSKGTANMVAQARAKGVQVVEIVDDKVLQEEAAEN